MPPSRLACPKNGAISEINSLRQTRRSAHLARMRNDWKPYQTEHEQSGYICEHCVFIVVYLYKNEYSKAL
jgi:hypothetical protein